MLTINNQSNYIRKELTIEMLKRFFKGELKKTIDHIPIDMNPRDNSMRCCVYKDRAMTRYRLMALLGMSIETMDDEYKRLTEYLDDAIEREKVDSPALTVLSVACSSCEKGSYKITDNCRGCLARPCETNCPFNAIRIIRGKAVIDEELCRNCGKCLNVCPFSAVIRTSVPCEENCPVGAVNRDADGHMSIDYEKCISCGRCSRSCPFGAVMERSHIIDVAKLLKSGRPVTAMLAPSIIGQFPGSLGRIVSAVRKAGFTTITDVAAGAEKTAAHEAAELTEKLREGQPLMTTSCCPAWVETAEKYIPEMSGFISSTPTPMNYSAMEVAEIAPGAARVFIGPCTAKKNEALRDGSADYVLSFEELGSLLIALDIDVNECAEDTFDNREGGMEARAFAASGGVSGAVAGKLASEVRQKLKPMKIDGLCKKNINLLKSAAAGKLDYNLIEVMSCEGGCICGPGVISNAKIAKKKLDEYVPDSA